MMLGHAHIFYEDTGPCRRLFAVAAGADMGPVRTTGGHSVVRLCDRPPPR